MKLIKVILFGALSLWAVRGSSAAAQVAVRGFVRSSDGKPIAAAEVGDRASGRKVQADSLGAFYLADVPAGDRILEVRRIGFVADQFPISLVVGRDRKVALTLTPLAQALPDINVGAKMAKPARYADTHRYDEFYERRALGIGKFLEREDIDRAFKSNTPELLQGMPGFLVRRSGNDWKVQSQHCASMLGSDPGKQVVVYLDGVRTGGASELSRVNPSEIEAMEVYTGPSELPAQARGDACAAIFIWTRRGG